MKHTIKIITFSALTLSLTSFSLNILAKNLSTKSPQLVTQNQIKNYCKSEESLFLSAETKNFWLNIGKVKL
jgi:hypothetical protein